MTDLPDQAALDLQEANLEKHAPELAMLSAEASRQMSEVNARIDSAASRATILISSAAVAAGIQATAASGWFQVTALICSLAAALLAIPVLIFRSGKPRARDRRPGATQRKGIAQELSIKERQDNILTWSPRRLEWDIINAKRVITMHDRVALDRRAAYFRWGCVSLALAIVFTGFQLTGWLTFAVPMHHHH